MMKVVMGMDWLTGQTTRLAGAAVVLLTACSAYGLVVVDGENNTTPSSEDAGWAYVGSLGNGTGVYLGNGWVMTVDHVTPYTALVLDNGQYPVISSSSVQFFNSDNSLVDLRLYRIEGDPGLDPLTIRHERVDLGTVSQLIASGAVAGDPVTRTVGSTTWQSIEWAKITCPQTDCPVVRDKLWGSNLVSSIVNRKVINQRVTYSFDMKFDSVNGAVPFESQVARHDSGGAVFNQNDQGQWELSGIIFGMTQGYEEEATFDYDKTFAVDLPYYRHAIFQAMYRLGDADLNGVVNLLDLVIVGEHFDTTSGAYWELGDFTGDQKVDLVDLTTLGENYGGSVAMTGSRSSTIAETSVYGSGVIPEPSVMMVLGVAGGLLLARRN